MSEKRMQNTNKAWLFSPSVIAMTLFYLTGCASQSEKILRTRYRESEGAFHETPGQVEITAAFDGNSTLDDYLRAAFSRNPGLRATFDRWKAALERVPQSRSLDDPTLSFEYFINQMDTRYQASLTQMFPAFGKLSLRGSRATAEAEAAMHMFEAERFILFERVVKAFYEYLYLSRAVAITEENLRLLSDLEQIVTTRYQTGLAPFADLIKVQVEKDRLADRLAALRDRRRPQSAALAALLNLSPGDPLPWPDFTPSGEAFIDEAVLQDMLADLNPELKSADSMVEAAEYRKKLARRSYLPDFMLGAGWMVMSGMEGKGDEYDMGLMAGINLPVWLGKYRAEVREAGSMIRAASNVRDNMSNNLNAELILAIFKFRDGERRIELFETSLLPKAGQALAVARKDYASGNTGFMTLIDAQRTLLEFELLTVRAAFDREIALGEIGRSVGRYDIMIDLRVTTSETESPR